MSEENKDFEENKDDQENSWEDDDFGLPDVDYTPLADQDDNDSADEEEKQESSESADFSFQTPESSVDDADDSPDDYNLNYADEEESYDQEEDEEEKPKKSSAGVIWTIVILLLISGGVAGYLFWYKPMQDNKAFTAFMTAGDSLVTAGNLPAAMESYENAMKIHPDDPDVIKKLEDVRAAIEKKKQEEAAAAKAAEEERLRREREAAEAAKKPKIGVIEKITARTGRYYVVVASNIDDDLAMDFAKRLSKQGVSSKIITPAKKGAYHRVTIEGDFGSAGEAQAKADELKGTYPNAWIVKF